MQGSNLETFDYNASALPTEQTDHEIKPLIQRYIPNARLCLLLIALNQMPKPPGLDKADYHRSCIRSNSTSLPCFSSWLFLVLMIRVWFPIQRDIGLFIRKFQGEITTVWWDIVRTMPNGRWSRAKEMNRCTTVILPWRSKIKTSLLAKQENKKTRRQQGCIVERHRNVKKIIRQTKFELWCDTPRCVVLFASSFVFAFSSFSVLL